MIRPTFCLPVTRARDGATVVLVMIASEGVVVDGLHVRPTRRPLPRASRPQPLPDQPPRCGNFFPSNWERSDRDMVSGAPIRVLLADDHPVVRRGLAALLGTLDDFEVVGEAEDGEAAVREAQLTKPDVVLMDVRMPGIDGVEATRRIRKAMPETAVLMLTMYDEDATVFTAMQAGARGYLLKGAEQDEIADAIRAVVRGQAIFGAAIASRMLEHFANPPGAAAPDDPFPELTGREKEILELLAQGRRTAEIASTLHLSPKTVSNNLTTIFAKLEVRRPDRGGDPGQGAGSRDRDPHAGGVAGRDRRGVVRGEWRGPAAASPARRWPPGWLMARGRARRD